MNDLRDPLQRATRRLAEPEEPGWVGLSHQIMSQVRSLVTPSPRVAVYNAEGGAMHDSRGSRTWVSGRVLTSALRRALQHPADAPSDLTLELDGDRCIRVSVELVAAYGHDLNQAAQHARVAARNVLAELLGPDPDGPVPIDIALVDIVEGDPRVV